MTWENSKRVRKKSKNRERWHADRIAEADTKKVKLSAACQWLISEAWRAGVLDDALNYVMTYINELREEDTNDRDNHAA